MDLNIALFLPLLLTISTTPADTAVLDPALYLYPSPPLSSSDGENAEHWSRITRSTRQRVSSETEETTTATPVIDEFESMENAETFWPRLRSIDYAIKQVHIPVTFGLSGNYGGYKGSNGVIGNAYANIGGNRVFNYGNSALAGSGYGNYGSSVRIFGGSDSPTWSGWGNGKWGHYGKG